MKLPYLIDNAEKTHLPWIVLINGLFAARESWSECLAALNPFFRILRYDGRGQGSGPTPEGPYSLHDQVSDLSELLDDLKIERAFFLGLSNGGRVALEFARQYRERATAVIAADTYAKVTTIMQLKLNSWKEAGRVGGGALRFDVAVPWVWGESALAKKPQLIAPYRESAAAQDQRVVEALIDGAMSGDIALHEIGAPTLLVVGSEDLLTPVHSHKELAARLPRSEILVIKGGHASLLEHPEEMPRVLEALANLLWREGRPSYREVRV